MVLHFSVKLLAGGFTAWAVSTISEDVRVANFNLTAFAFSDYFTMPLVT
jgi:hypothetical protein